MEWLAENWIFVIFLAAFVAMHLFGHRHGGHGGHGGRGGSHDHGENKGEKPAGEDAAPGSARPGSKRADEAGHRH